MTLFCATVPAEEEEEEAEKAFLHFYVNVPPGPPLSQILHNPEKRRKLGESTCVCENMFVS